MTPSEFLRAGAQLLDPILGPQGFAFRVSEVGKGSGGNYAAGSFVRKQRRLQLHMRYSLGLVTYHEGSVFLEHASYLKGLGVPIGAAHYPGFSEDPLDGFRHLAFDLHEFLTEFVSGDATTLVTRAPLDALARTAAARRNQATYVGDDAKRREARRLFRLAEYGAALQVFHSLFYPEFLTPSERTTMNLALKRTTE